MHDVEAYVLGDIGAALMGFTREQAALIFKGATGSGKSTLARVLQPILGGGLVSAVEFETLWGDKPDPSILAKLQGKRLITVAEVGGRGDALRFKKTTGGDMLSMRVAYASQDLEFAVTGRIIATGNAVPKFYDNSGAIERRMRIVNVAKSVAIRDPDLDSKAQSRARGHPRVAGHLWGVARCTGWRARRACLGRCRSNDLQARARYGGKVYF